MQNTSCVGAFVIVTQWFLIFNNFNKYQLFFTFFYESLSKLFCVEHQFGGMIHSNLFQLVIFPNFTA
jgi:hypothetical protein